ncbi:MAG: chemotaxis protein CheB [Candidatus Eisenbacteria bacterium]
MTRLVVIGGSSGAIQPLLALLHPLPRDLPAAMLVVIHGSSRRGGGLPRVLSRSSGLPVKEAEDGEEIRAGRVYVAMPDRHLLVGDGHVRVVRGPRENGFRPAVDPLFISAASAYGPSVIGVLLSGSLDDGTYGLAAIKEQGGIAIVQEPSEALFPSMPLSALRSVEVDHVVPVPEISVLLERLARSPATTQGVPSEPEGEGVGGRTAEPSATTPKVSVYTCPDCGGSLWEVERGGVRRYRCRVGHAFGPETLLARQRNRIEAALWSALRALEEQASLSDRMALHARESGWEALHREYEARARAARERAQDIQDLLALGKRLSGEMEGQDPSAD